MKVIDERIEVFTSDPKFVKMGMIREDMSDYVVFVDRLTGQVYIEEIVYKTKTRNCDLVNNDLTEISDDNLWKELVGFAHIKKIITNEKLDKICGMFAKTIRKRDDSQHK